MLHFSSIQHEHQNTTISPALNKILLGSHQPDYDPFLSNNDKATNDSIFNNNKKYTGFMMDDSSVLPHNITVTNNQAGNKRSYHNCLSLSQFSETAMSNQNTRYF